MYSFVNTPLSQDYLLVNFYHKLQSNTCYNVELDPTEHPTESYQFVSLQTVDQISWDIIIMIIMTPLFFINTCIVVFR